jgi:cytochrome P450
MHARLRDEIRAAFQPFQMAPYSQARALPYLDAVVRETLRYHPPICFALERVVPATGLPLPDGSVVPGGQIGGINAWVVQRNKGVYGEDADEFKPERWLQREGEGDEEYKERMRKWSEAMLVFGGGSRICLGRHLGLMEIYKAVASVFATFDIELENPEKDWWIQLRWFARSKGVICKLKPRGK